MCMRTEDVLKLPIAERIKLAADIWDSVATTPEQIDVSAETRDPLRHRLKAYRKTRVPRLTGGKSGSGSRNPASGDPSAETYATS